MRMLHHCTVPWFFHTAALVLAAVMPAAIQAQVLEIRLGDVAAGGDGTGTSSPDVVGIHPDTGVLEMFHVNAPILVNDGTSLQPVEDDVSEFIDSVFIIDRVDMPISTTGAFFSFPPEDLLSPPETWDHILRDRIGGEDFPVVVGGTTFDHAVGIHSAAGITYDLEALRAAHGEEAVGVVTAFMGMGDSPSCLASPGWVTTHLIVSTEEEVLDASSHRTSRGGKWASLRLPQEARFLTLATGAGNAQFYCNAGTFAAAAITPRPPVFVERQVPGGFLPGDTIRIEILVEVNEPVATLEVRERIPRTWRALNPSPSGRVEAEARGRESVVWSFTGGVQSQVLSYDLRVPDPYANVSFVGGSAVAGGRNIPIFGDQTVEGGSSPNPREALAVFLRQAVGACADGAAPGEGVLRRDFLTDGDTVTEAVVAPAAGEGLSPDFNGASPSPGPAGPATLTWTRIPAQPGGWFELDVCDSCMAYVGVYVVNPTAETLPVRVASASDDSELILVDGKEVWVNNVARGAATGAPQDYSPVFDLTPGKHLVLQKVFEGCGGFNSTLLFTDEDTNPLVIFKYTLDPSAGKPDAGDPGYDAARAFVLRQIPPSLEVGETGTIGLRLRVKAGAGLVGGTILEKVPPAFAIGEISEGGSKNGQELTWNLGGEIQNRDLSYEVSIPEGALDATFDGTATLGGVEGPIAGDRTFSRGAMNEAGFIKHWLVFGPLDTFELWPGDVLDPVGDPHGPSGTPELGDIRLDYLTDGTVTEETIRPFDGMRHLPAFQGDGLTASKALAHETLSRECAPATPTWEAFASPTGTFNNDEYFGENIESHTTYAAAYLTNHTGGEIRTNVAINSDDAFIAYLNGTEFVAFEPPPCSNAGCGRGYGAEDSVVEVMPVAIPAGESFLLTRVHDGFGGSGHRLRFQDADGNPLLPPALTVSLKSAVNPPEVHVRRILSSDTYRLPDTPSVTLRIDSRGTHDVKIREALPAGWSAVDISRGGSEAAGVITWDLKGVSGTGQVSYKLSPGQCPGGGEFCGNGDAGSSYTIDGNDLKTHSLNGDRSFRRDTRGTDDLGPWDVRDIGSTGGGTQRAGERGADVTGKGAGVRSTKDEFRFVSIGASGDFEIAARIDCLDDPGGAGQAGLMVRDTFDTFSAQVFFALSSPPAGGGAHTLRGIFRRETHPLRVISSIVISDREVPALPIWLKLKRTGATISLQRSADGTSFAEVARRDIGTGTTQVNLGADTRVGLAVTGGGGAARGAYREVSGGDSGGPFPTFEPLPPDPVNWVRGNCNGDSQVDISDAIALLNNLFLGAAVECQEACNANGAEYDISDGIWLLNFLFQGGPKPVGPYPACERLKRSFVPGAADCSMHSLCPGGFAP